MTKTKSQNSKRDLLDLMSRLVQIHSVFPKEQAIANFIEQYLLRLQFRVTRVPVESGRDSLIATYGKNKTYHCFYAHMDTVPPDPAWRNNPFSVTVENDIARGLGVADMKGGLAIILCAAKYAREHDLPVKLAFGVDEENISLGSYALTKTDFFKNVSLLISAESGQVTNKAQDFSVVYGRKGRFVIEAIIQGVGAHAARSDIAINAITQTAQFISFFHQMQLAEHSRLGKTEITPFLIESHTDSFSIPNICTVRLNVLTVPGVTSAQVIIQLKKASRALRVQAQFQLMKRRTPYMEAYEVNRQNRIIKRLERRVFSEYKVYPGYASSVADENRFANDLKIPVISIGPIGGDDHTANEWVSLLSMQKTLAAYEKLMNVLL